MNLSVFRNRLSLFVLGLIFISFSLFGFQIETGEGVAHDEPRLAATTLVEIAQAEEEIACGPNRVFLQADGGDITVEAEHFTRHSGAIGGNDWLPTAEYGDEVGNGLAMGALPNIGTTTFLETSGPYLEYDIEFDTPGTYYVFVRGLGGELPRRHVNDSLHFGLNGVPVTTESGVGFTGFRTGSFNWKDRSNGWNPTVIEVPSAGLQTVNIWLREDGVTIDRFHLSQAADFDVSSPDIGPAESTCLSNNPPSPEAVAWDMVNSTSQRLISFETDAAPFLSPADCFGKKQRGVDATIPFGALDDSLTIFPDDDQGIIGESNREQFFCIVDTINDQNQGELSARWQFDIANVTDLSLNFDFGAMGNFETTDQFALSYQIDEGDEVQFLQSSVDLEQSHLYVLDDGDIFELEDPIFANGVLLDNNLQTFSEPISNTGSILTVVLSATVSADTDAVVMQNMIIEGLAVAPPPPPDDQLLITEIMYNPASVEPTWEWIEIYNAGETVIDLAGYVVDDANAEAMTQANIGAAVLNPGQSGVLYNSDLLFPENYTEAWGDVNLIPVSDWGSMELNNTGDTIGIWDSFASYEGDNETLANAIVQVPFEDSGEWPADSNAASIYLVDLEADPTLGSSWALSSDGGETPVNTTYISLAAGGNSGQDVGSPGLAPAPPPPPVIELLITEIMYNPASTEPAWEWVEIYNNGNVTLDLAGYVIDDSNTVLMTEANIGAGTIEPAASAILYNADALTLAQFQTAWGDVNAIPVTNWLAMALGNSGDTVSIWDSFESYQADLADDSGVFEPMVSLTYDDDGVEWPRDTGFASIYLIGLDADPALGSSWAISEEGAETPVGTTRSSTFGGGNNGLDVGSP